MSLWSHWPSELVLIGFIVLSVVMDFVISSFDPVPCSLQDKIQTIFKCPSVSRTRKHLQKRNCRLSPTEAFISCRFLTAP